MGFVILHPGSNTNPSEFYRVVPYDAWVAYIQGRALAFPVVGEYGTYGEASALREELNAPLSV